MWGSVLLRSWPRRDWQVSQFQSGEGIVRVPGTQGPWERRASRGPNPRSLPVGGQINLRVLVEELELARPRGEGKVFQAEETTQKKVPK